MRSTPLTARLSAALLIAVLSATPSTSAHAASGSFSEPPAVIRIKGAFHGQLPRNDASVYLVRTDGLLLAGEVEAPDGWVERVYSGGTFEVHRVPPASGSEPAEGIGERCGAGFFHEFLTRVHPGGRTAVLKARLEFTETGPLGPAGDIARLTGPTTSSSLSPIPEGGRVMWQASLFEEIIGTAERSWGAVKRDFR
ncbi:MAG: hypothetical protein ABIH26_13000 [Candidatus Eisenbacteria bacterium]